MNSQPNLPTKTPLGILICFLISGAAGLVYQVSWVQALGLVFGHTVYAIATVLAVFMCGIASGTAYFGRRAEQHPSPVSLYARLELVIALTGILSLPMIRVVNSGYVAVYPSLDHFHPLLYGLRFLGAAMVLFIPTFLMGGTLPILVAATTQTYNELALRVSQLYWINTAGAVAGTLLAGFVLLPAFGLRSTIATAAACNVVAGLIALRLIALGLDRGSDSPKTSGKLVVSARRATLDRRETSYPALLLVMSLAGCSSFAYEIAWTRLLAVSIGSSTYAFTLMLATFLSGIVLGSALFQIFLSRSAQRISFATLSQTQMGIGLFSLCSLILFHWIPAIVPPMLLATGRTFAGLIATQFVTTVLTVLPAAILFGLNFPLLIALLSRRLPAGPGRSALVGKAYAANTLGAIAGSLATGFWLVPWLGSYRVLAGVAVFHLLIGLSIHLSLRPVRVLLLATDGVFIFVALVVASSSFFFNQPLLQLSTVLYGGSYQGRLHLSEIAATKDLIFAAEGVNDSVAVVRTDDDIALRLNGKIDASTQDSRTQLMLGHLGEAFHSSPRVLIIGFGSGMTVSAVARYPDVQKIDCVEIEPAVLRAAPYLHSLNRGVLSDPRLHIIFNDARTSLLTSRDRYDLIISEPSNPWIAGVSTLFTTEFYAAARQRLAPGGIFVQWVQEYSLSPPDLRMILASFAPHFPEVTLWRAGETDLLLLGRSDASRLGFDRLRSLWKNQSLRQDFAALDINEPEGLSGYFVLNDPAVRQLAGNSNLNTDDRTRLEYNAPRTLLTPELAEIDQQLIERFRNKPLPSNLRSSDVKSALKAGLTTALALGEINGVKAFLKALDSEPDSAGHEMAKGRLALLEADLPRAQQCLEAAFTLNPQSPEAAYWLAVAERRSGKDASALSHVQAALRLDPQFLPALETQMELAAERKDYRTALSAQLRRMALMANPPAYEYCRLGALWIGTTDFRQAESALLQGLAKDPYCYACHSELGELYLRTGKLRLARREFEWVVRFFPDSDPSAFRLLAGIDLTLHDEHSARAVLAEGRRVFPEDAGLKEAEADRGG